MKAKILYLASILVALSGMLVVPGMAVKEADACPGGVCIIPPAGNPGQGDPEADNKYRCYSDCDTCCWEECENSLALWEATVGDPNCWCTEAATHRKCGDPEP